MSHPGGQLEARHVSDSFPVEDGVLEVLNDITFSVSQGEIVGVIGPSGCGKSTLLRNLGGLRLPKQGRVFLDGEPVLAPSARVSFMFQEDSLLPWKTAEKNVAFSLIAGGCSAAEATERAREYLDLVGLAGFDDYYPASLSGGMKQRVALARALCTEPEVTLMDEPLGALDAELREQMQSEILRIQHRLKHTVVIVSHSIDEVVFLPDRVMVLGPRPAQIVEEIEICLPRPRPRAIRGSPEFLDLEANLWNCLATARENAGQSAGER